MGGYRKCAVVGCENTDAPRHRFPNPAKNMDLFKKWIQACNNQNLVNLQPDLVYRSHRICHVHFTAEDKSTNMFLKKHAVPSLYLPSPTVLVNIPCKLSLFIL